MLIRKNDKPASVGDVFGHLTVLEIKRMPKGNKMPYHAVCLCGCGNTCECLLKSLTRINKPQLSCGCRIGKSLIGVKFAKFTVIARDMQKEQEGKRSVWWLCQCACGVVRSYTSAQVRNKKINECLECYNRRISPVSPAGEITRGYWSRVIRNASDRGLEFDVSCELAWQVFLGQGRKCALSGESLQFCTSVRDPKFTASLDRIDSGKGYTPDNIQWVHKTVNLIKMHLSEQEFLNWCSKIHAHNKA